MVNRLIFWLILFGLGALAGERYGLPGLVTGLTDRGFDAIESAIGAGGTADEADTPEDAVDSEAPDLGETTSSAAGAASAPYSGDLGNEANANLRINDAGLQIIKNSEGLRLEAYNLGGQWLIGYGHSRTARSGMTITEAQAAALLREDVRDAEDAVKRMVTVALNENEFSALVSLAYNLGSGGFSKTSVLEVLNTGDRKGAADAFLNHNRARIDGELQVIDHLTHRREQERALFLTPA